MVKFVLRRFIRHVQGAGTVFIVVVFIFVCAGSGRNDKDLISNRVNVKETIKHN